MILSRAAAFFNREHKIGGNFGNTAENLLIFGVRGVNILFCVNINVF